MKLRQVALASTLLSCVFSAVSSHAADFGAPAKPAVSGINGTFGIFGGIVDAYAFDTAIPGTDMD